MNRFSCLVIGLFISFSSIQSIDYLDVSSAVARGNLAEVERVFENIDAQISENEKGMVFIGAANRPYLDIVQFLYKQWGTQISDYHIGAAFFDAAQKGYLDIVKWLYEEAEARISRFFIDMSVNYAIENGHLDVFLWLYERAGNRMSKEGIRMALWRIRSALIIASGIDLVKKLYGEVGGMLDYDIERLREQIEDKRIMVFLQTLILDAVQEYLKDSVAFVTRLIEENNINYQYSPYNQTVLMWAAIFDNSDIVEKLIKSGAGLLLRDDKGRTAIMLATMFGNSAIVGLLANNMDLNRSDIRVLISIASKYGWYDLAGKFATFLQIGRWLF